MNWRDWLRSDRGRSWGLALLSFLPVLVVVVIGALFHSIESAFLARFGALTSAAALWAFLLRVWRADSVVAAAQMAPPGTPEETVKFATRILVEVRADQRTALVPAAASGSLGALFWGFGDYCIDVIRLFMQWIFG